MLVESYALESAWSIISAISYGIINPAVVLFMGSDSTIKVCVIYHGNDTSHSPLTYLGYCVSPRCLSCCDWTGVDLRDKTQAHELAMEP